MLKMIYKRKMNGLRRNQDAIKRLAGINLYFYKNKIINNFHG